MFVPLNLPRQKGKFDFLKATLHTHLSSSFATHQVEAGACPLSFHRCRWAGCLRSPQASRNHFCCHCHPGAASAWPRWSQSPSRCRPRWRCEGRAPPASYQPWNRSWAEFETTTKGKRLLLIVVSIVKFTSQFNRQLYFLQIYHKSDKYEEAFKLWVSKQQVRKGNGITHQQQKHDL